MPLIPARFRRGKQNRSNLAFAQYSQATWRWWCARQGVEFLALDKPVTAIGYERFPPTFLRWLAVERLLRELGNGVRLAVVDADTMIRWDAPNFFDLPGSGGLAAVRDTDPSWIGRSIGAFQPFFPGVNLPVSDYINAGIVILGEAHLPVIRAFLELSVSHWDNLSSVIQSGDFGTDQTLLNFVLRCSNERIDYLPQSLNVLCCCEMAATLWDIEKRPLDDWQDRAERMFSLAQNFELVGTAHVWHFAYVVTLRRLAMKEAWRQVCLNYPGAVLSG
jgi:hypothetical protein